MQFNKFALSAAVLALVDARGSIPACTSFECKKKSKAAGWDYDLPTEAATGRLVQMNESDSESDSSDDEEMNVQFATKVEQFSTDDDDLFMRSMIENYAKEAEDKDGAGTGAWWVTKAQAAAGAGEVLCTHKKICGAELQSYMDTYLSKAWGHFDVNQVGKIEVIKMPQFVRFLASDQYFQFMFPK